MIRINIAFGKKWQTFLNIIWSIPKGNVKFITLRTKVLVKQSQLNSISMNKLFKEKL